MVVVVGDHATYHKKYDAPLESDIDAVADTVSGRMRSTDDTADVASDAGRSDSREPIRLAHLDADPARRCVLVRRRATRANGPRPARRSPIPPWRLKCSRCCDPANPR